MTITKLYVRNTPLAPISPHLNAIFAAERPYQER